MISLSISNGTATALSITDTGSSGYVLESLDPGSVERENVYARSRWVDGAYLTSSRTELSSLTAVVQCWGTSTADMYAKVDALGSAVGQFGYTVTASYTGGSAVYTALPATYDVTYDPNWMRSNAVLVTLNIPVQP